MRRKAPVDEAAVAGSSGSQLQLLAAAQTAVAGSSGETPSPATQTVGCSGIIIDCAFGLVVLLLLTQHKNIHIHGTFKYEQVFVNLNT